MSNLEFVLGWLSIAVIVGLFVWIGLALFVAYTKIEIILMYLKNCSAVMSLSHLKNGGPWGRLLLIGGISGFVTFPMFYVRRGVVNADDVKNLPGEIKRVLVFMQLSVVFLLLSMVVLAVIVKVVRS